MKYKQISLSIGMKYSKYFTLLLKEDGTVWSVGSNYFGQLGTGDRKDCLGAARASVLSDIASVQAGNLHSAALTRGGEVLGFGLNINGCLGELPAGPNPVPKPIPKLRGVTQIAAAGDMTFALASDHTLYALGDGLQTIPDAAKVYAGANESYIEMLDGSFKRFANGKKAEPAPELNSAFVREISVGNSHVAVLTKTGTVLCRGDNSNGQLGLENAESSDDFVDMGLSGITAVAAGGSHTLARGSQGEVYVWGFNFFGQLGDGTGTRRNKPQIVEGLPAAEIIAAGTFNSMIMTAEGEIYGWGSDDFGQLGDMTCSQRREPHLMEGVTGVKMARAGLYHSAVLADGKLYVSGCNLYGQLGDGKNDVGRHVFTPLLDGITDVEAGGTHTVAIDAGGRVWSWGNNACGQIGNGASEINPDGKLGGGERHNIPMPIMLDVPPVKHVAAGENHTLFLRDDGDVYAAGMNNFGQLGDGARHNSSAPLKIAALKNIREIHAHKFRSLAIDADGNLYCWGYNGSGELGTGDAEPRLVPQIVMDNVRTVIPGGWYTLAVKNDGTVWAFGMNADGQFGDGTNAGSLSPRDVTPFYNGFAAVAAGGFHTAALKPDGTVWTCGKNEFGELGGGPPMSRNVFSPVPGLRNVKAISAGWFCVFAITEDDMLFAFGRNNFGQLCHPDANRCRPVRLQ